jgi:large repetitive protein
MRGSPGRGVVASLLLVALLLCGNAAGATSREEYQDSFPPDTGIRKGPPQKTDKRKATFEFGGSEPGVTFECRLDVGLTQGPWVACASPYRIRGLARRTKYVFAVRAVDAAGNPDPTPADRRWKVTKRKRKKDEGG